MTTETRAGADDGAPGDEAEQSTPVLSDWLAGNLRTPRAGARSEPPPPAATSESDRDPDAESATPGEENTPVLGSQDVPPPPAPSTLAPQVLPPEELGADIEVDPALLFLAQERRARRAQRMKLTLAAGCLALLACAYLLFRLTSSDPPAEVAEGSAQAAAAAQAAADPATPAPLEDSEQALAETEVAESEAVPQMKAGLGAMRSNMAPSPPSDPSTAPVAIPGGPSTARYPDLPRDVLIQLEKASEKPAP